MHQRKYRRPRHHHCHRYRYRYRSGHHQWLTLGDRHLHLRRRPITLLDQRHHYLLWQVRHPLLWSLRYLQMAHRDQRKP